MWDGDLRKLRKWLTKVCSFFVPSPLRGMVTVKMRWLGIAYYYLRSKPTAWDGDSSVGVPSGVSN